MNSKHTERLNMAIAWAEDARRDALQRVRAAGNPRNPARAQEGQEQEFDAAKKDAFGFALILAELKTCRRQDYMSRIARFVSRVVGDYVLPILGLMAFTTILKVYGVPRIITQVVLFAGTWYVVARADSKHEARK